MNFLTSINNLLMWLTNHWSELTICLALGVAFYRKIRDFLAKSDDDKVQIALKQVKEIILEKVTSAELDYAGWKQSGSFKRSQVLNEIFEQYPILSKVTSQEEIVEKLDAYIDEALVTMREILNNNGFPAGTGVSGETKESEV